jgi:hypothetical protein
MTNGTWETSASSEGSHYSRVRAETSDILIHSIQSHVKHEGDRIASSRLELLDLVSFPQFHNCYALVYYESIKREVKMVLRHVTDDVLILF